MKHKENIALEKKYYKITMYKMSHKQENKVKSEVN